MRISDWSSDVCSSDLCYGQQTMAAQLGGGVSPSDHREFGRAFVEVVEHSALFDGVWQVGEKHQVWMSHGDRVDTLPDGFRIIAHSEGAPYAATADEARRFYGVQDRKSTRLNSSH